MATLLLVAGPPASARMWQGVVDRLTTHGHDARAVPLFDPAPADPTVSGLAATLADTLRATEDPVLVAHGTAVPVALAAAGPGGAARLVLTNGALGGLDPVTRAVCAAAQGGELFARGVLRPAIWQRWLASSVGLRRAVVNPYVMDRDTVVTLSEPYLRTRDHRRAVTRYLAQLPAAVSEVSDPGVPTLLLWGDEDPLQPMHVADSARRWLPGAEVSVVPGGQHFHPVERPWAFADAVDEWLAGERSPEAAAG